VQIEQQFTSFDAAVRGPINSIKEQAFKLGSGATSSGSQLVESASVSTGPLDGVKEKALRLGSGLTAGGSQLLESATNRIYQVGRGTFPSFLGTWRQWA